TTKTSLRIGILYEDTQMTKFAGLDLLGNLAPQIIDLVAEIMPTIAPFKQLAIPMEFLYISSSRELTKTTPYMYVKPTHTYENGLIDLKIILLGGPNLMTVKEGSLTFLQWASQQTKIMLTTCSGAMWLVRSGVLDGKKASTNRMMLGAAKMVFPKVEWLDQRWVFDAGAFRGRTNLDCWRC
ncbi:hypothetical protein EJ02DRAFT_332509, partial [Clathrospora elynae]